MRVIYRVHSNTSYRRTNTHQPITPLLPIEIELYWELETLPIVLKKVGRNFFNKTRRQPNLHVLRPFELFEKDPAEREYLQNYFLLKLCRIEPVGIFFLVRVPSFNFILCPQNLS
jgi:hypothetical protein